MTDSTRILLVEDNKVHAELIYRAFCSAPYADRFQLTVVHSLAEAQDRIEQAEPPHLVIADLVLPDGQGTDLLAREAREAGSQPPSRFPLVILTGQGNEKVAIDTLRKGALDYVIKSAQALADLPRIAERVLREWGHIIEQEQAEQALRESQALLKATIESLPFDIFALDADGHYILQNSHCIRRWGKVTGKRPGDIAPAEDIMALWPDNYRSALAGETAREDVTLEKDGRSEHLHNIVAPIFFEGQISGVIGVNIDITERVRAEEALRHYSERLKTLHEIDRAILAAESPEAIAQAVLQRMGRLVSCSAGMVVSLDLASGEFQVLVARIADQTQKESGESFPLSLIESLDAYRSGQTRTVHDIAAETEVSGAQQMLLDRGIHSYICVPLLLEQQLIGLFVLGADRPRFFTQDQINVAEEVASSLVVAIQHARLREQFQIHTQQITASLREKEALLHEIQHRVKNNLQVISSLLNLQAERIHDAKVLEALTDSRDRVQSMALVHEALYQTGDLAQIDFGKYIQDLTQYLFRAHQTSPALVDLKVDVQNASLGIDQAIPCGLIISELVSNALKHAFLGEKRGEVSITFRHQGRRYLLIVCDDGIGLPAEIDLRRPQSLGLELVATLVGQLEGQLEIDRGTGTTFQITFSEGGWDQER